MFSLYRGAVRHNRAAPLVCGWSLYRPIVVDLKILYGLELSFVDVHLCEVSTLQHNFWISVSLLGLLYQEVQRRGAELQKTDLGLTTCLLEKVKWNSVLTDGLTDSSAIIKVWLEWQNAVFSWNTRCCHVSCISLCVWKTLGIRTSYSLVNPSEVFWRNGIWYKQQEPWMFFTWRNYVAFRRVRLKLADAFRCFKLQILKQIC